MNIIIDLNKPKGITSQQAVTKVKKLLGVRKAGHTGTLDPMATGVLLVCLNEATKVSRFLLDKDKTYRARLKLGERTDTLDADGKLIETRDVPPFTPGHIVSVAKQFVGKIMQKPPMYSAIKLNGQPLYRLARKGLEVERAERPVEIYDIKLLQMDIPYVDMLVVTALRERPLVAVLARRAVEHRDLGLAGGQDVEVGGPVLVARLAFICWPSRALTT